MLKTAIYSTLLLFYMATTACAAEPAAGDWPWWRGPSHNGIAAGEKPPVQWSGSSNILWKTPVPGRGHGSPAVAGDRVFLATADEKKGVQSVLCFHRDTGKQLWKTDVHKGRLHPKNKKASQASSSFACDGGRVYVNFLSDGAVRTSALTVGGDIVWQKKVCDYKVHQGYGSSPLLYKSLVIVSADNKLGGAVVAFKRESGDEVWRRTRPKKPNYPSPVIHRTAGRDQLLLTGCNLVTSLDPLTGEELWEIKGSTTECVTTTVTHGDLMFTSGGYPDDHISAVKTDGSGKIVWANRERVYVPSMLVHNGYLYGILDRGVAACWNCKTGKEMWKVRLGGTVTASPVMAGGLIYSTSETGETVVLQATPGSCKILHRNQLGDEVYATMAIAGGRIFQRIAEKNGNRQEYLVCIGAK